MTFARGKIILRANLRFVAMCVTGWLAWISWGAATPRLWALYPFAVIMAGNALVCGVGGIADCVRLVLVHRRIKAFGEQADPARPDPMATKDDLQNRGMLK